MCLKLFIITLLRWLVPIVFREMTKRLYQLSSILFISLRQGDLLLQQRNLVHAYFSLSYSLFAGFWLDGRPFLFSYFLQDGLHIDLRNDWITCLMILIQADYFIEGHIFIHPFLIWAAGADRRITVFFQVGGEDRFRHIFGLLIELGQGLLRLYLESIHIHFTNACFFYVR